MDNETINQQMTSASQPIKKPIKLRNFIQETETVDKLYQRCTEEPYCSNQVCPSSVTSLPYHGTNPRKKEEVLMYAKDFLEQYFMSIGRLNSDSHRCRWESIQEEVLSTGTYQLTETELVFGAKLAWRNAARCIGRIQWSKLQVFDCRFVTTTKEMFTAICDHIKYSTNKGNIRSAITIFPQRTDGEHDYRVWNRQIIGYAGYKNEDGTILGDPTNVEFTDLCLKLGWNGPSSSSRTRFDILPLVLSANGCDPDYFDIAAELVLEVPLKHPTYKWFEELRLKWYVLPVVSSMVFDCGGLEFTAAPFNGWYMSTEIGARNLCDVNRYNLLETIAVHMHLDIRTPYTLWKDKAMIEMNVAVLYSFQIENVTIIDHHTASDSFMRHYETEMRLRKGCPADWSWIVPPISGSVTAVFHQEMALYYLKPSYGAQDLAWKTHVWKKGLDNECTSDKSRRRLRFKHMARAIKFTSKIFARALSRRIKASVLFATETGTSQIYANKLGKLLDHAFHSRIFSMDKYDISNIEHESLIFIITSTFGNGDPPENGETFAQSLHAMQSNEAQTNRELRKRLTLSKLFMETNNQSEDSPGKSDRSNSFTRTNETSQNKNTSDPLSNVHFAVFALGSLAYPNFCAFGRYVDNLLGELGGKRLLNLCQGDEMCGQEQAFRTWAAKIFAVACETFCIDDDCTLQEVLLSLDSEALSKSTARFVVADPQPISEALSRCHNRNVTMCNVMRKSKLTAEDSGVNTLLLELDDLPAVEIAYKPGDHLGVFARNKHELVEGILACMEPTIDFDTPMELQTREQFCGPKGIIERWVPHDRFYPNSLRTLLMRFIDITTPPTPNLLRYFASIATDINEKTELNLLATDSIAYEDWKHWKYPNLLEVLQEFPSVKPHAPVFILHLNLLQPRFYSISSSPLVHQGRIHLTVAIVQYKSQGGAGPIRYGLCSNYLNDVTDSEPLYVFVRSAPNFHMPPKNGAPIILIGPGTGIAPFRGFWQHRLAEKQLNSQQEFGEIWLFFGCRQKTDDLYRLEKQEMLEIGVLKKAFLALSREIEVKKTYVQDLIQSEGSQIYNMLIHKGGHVYVCGDCKMAEDVHTTLKYVIAAHGQMAHEEAEACMNSLKDQNRYHEDIFGITLHTKKVHNRLRGSARINLVTKLELS